MKLSGGSSFAFAGEIGDTVSWYTDPAHEQAGRGWPAAKAQSVDSDAEVLPPYVGDKPRYSDQVAEAATPAAKAKRKLADDAEWTAYCKGHNARRRAHELDPERIALVASYRAALTEQWDARRKAAEKPKKFSIGKYVTLEMGKRAASFDVRASWPGSLGLYASPLDGTFSLASWDRHGFAKFYWQVEPLQRDMCGRRISGLRLFSRKNGGGGITLRILPTLKLTWNF